MKLDKVVLAKVLYVVVVLCEVLVGIFLEVVCDEVLDDARLVVVVVEGAFTHTLRCAVNACCF